MKPPHEEGHFKRSGFGAMRKSCAFAFPTGPLWAIITSLTCGWDRDSVFYISS